MKICIVGAGALGSTIGGVLAENGSEVYLINRREEFVEAINKKGLILRSGTTDRVVAVNARTSCAGIGHVDLVIILVKSFHTKQAIENAKEIIGENTMVLSLQNGLGNEEVIAEVVGKERVLAGKTYVGGVVLGPGHVLATTGEKQTHIGELDGRITERVKRVAKVFNHAGLMTNVTSNIIGIIWDKLLINAATGPLSGITRLPYGGLYQVPEIKEIAVAAVLEGISVAKAHEVKLDTEDPETIWRKAAEGLPDEFKTSLLQSIEKGSETEIDYINGAIVRWGEKRNILTPVNKTLVANIKGIEYGLKYIKEKERII
ncbi:ketopantoate reductase family protein [Sporosarcina sp. 179-K 3D1 HS]|uniref:ketopantoate reductase family protein n=1 Tax=Sporosarcina sp. 179-K 3D1 HS TaxID=3232169 RepID=UPI0039A2DA23